MWSIVSDAVFIAVLMALYLKTSLLVCGNPFTSTETYFKYQLGQLLQHGVEMDCMGQLHCQRHSGLRVLFIGIRLHMLRPRSHIKRARCYNMALTRISVGNCTIKDYWDYMSPLKLSTIYLCCPMLPNVNI